MKRLTHNNKCEITIFNQYSTEYFCWTILVVNISLQVRQKLILFTFPLFDRWADSMWPEFKALKLTENFPSAWRNTKRLAWLEEEPMGKSLIAQSATDSGRRPLQLQLTHCHPHNPQPGSDSLTSHFHGCLDKYHLSNFCNHKVARNLLYTDT